MAPSTSAASTASAVRPAPIKNMVAAPARSQTTPASVLAASSAMPDPG